MKRIIASLAIGFSALTGQAHAWVGGPFDNGFHNKSFEKGIYQAALIFKNGGGYSYFSPNQVIASEIASDPSLINQRGSLSNRAVLYYKGVSYVGSAFGTADGEARDIQCTMNGTSESTLKAGTTQQQTNAFVTATSTTLSLDNTVVSSSRSFSFNGHWEGKITSTAPSLRFSGKGELAFLAPGGADSIAALAFSRFAGLIDAIITAVGNANTTGTTAFPATFFSDAGDSITDILTQMADPTSDIGKIISQSGVEATFDNAEVIKLKVTGTRRF